MCLSNISAESSVTPRSLTASENLTWAPAAQEQKTKGKLKQKLISSEETVLAKVREGSPGGRGEIT